MAIVVVKVYPKSKKNEVVGYEKEVIKIRVKQIPEKGKANDAVIEVLSKFFKVPKSNIKILTGKSARIKRVSIEGI